MKRTALKRRSSKGKLGTKPNTRLKPKHRQWVRGFMCAAQDGRCAGDMQAHHETCDIPADLAHLRAGVGLKAADLFCVPLCVHHHQIRHSVGAVSFAEAYGVDLPALALRLARQSPHLRRTKQ